MKKIMVLIFGFSFSIYSIASQVNLTQFKESDTINKANNNSPILYDPSNMLIGLEECLQKNFTQNKYVNFDQYIYVNGYPKDLYKLLRSAKVISRNVYKSTPKGRVDTSLKYSIDNNIYTCKFSIEFSNKNRDIKVLSNTLDESRKDT